jgi:hypothetical protein
MTVHLKLAILSDLHVAEVSLPEKSEAARSNILRLGTFPKQRNQPLADLVRLISDSRMPLHADYLICPGDLTDAAGPHCLAYGWDALERVAETLGEAKIIATVGNHDVDSRGMYDKQDPIAALRSLSPQFPVPDESLRHSFWAEHFTIYEADSARFLILNTCAHHHKNAELERGYLHPDTLNRILTELEGKSSMPVNILVCHHHPHHHGYPTELIPDVQVLVNGEVLLRKLSDLSGQPWLVVHGHRHFSNLEYAKGTSISPIVLGAGSLGIALPSKMRGQVGNQFHMVDIRADDPSLPPLCGTVRSWDWVDGLGWVPTRSPFGIPHIAGFGVRDTASELAKDITDSLKSFPVDWAEVLLKVPRLQFVTPGDFQLLERELRSKHGLVVLRLSEAPMQLARKV